MTIKIILIDESAIFRSGLKKFLSDEEIEIIGEAATGDQGQRLIRQKQPDMVLLDLDLPDTTGIQVCDYTQTHFPQINVVFLLNRSDLAVLSRLITTSAKGFLTKNSRYSVIDAIKTVYQGGHYLQPDMAWELIQYRGKNYNPERQLTDREYQIMHLIERGKTYEEIAEITHVSLKTVFNLKSSSCKKLGITDCKNFETLKDKNHDLYRDS